MFLIGLTGGIASGKSTVSSYLKSFGAELIDADQIAREVVEPDQPAWRQIVSHFGEDLLLADRRIDRARLGDRIFRDKKAKKMLEKFTHQQILAEILRRLRTLEQQRKPVVVLDIPLLYEVGWEGLVDEVWVVYADRETQLSRLMRRNHLTRDEAQLRLDGQWDLKEKARRAAAVIQNGGDRESAKKQVLKHWDRIQKKKGVLAFDKWEI